MIKNVSKKYEYLFAALSMIFGLYLAASFLSFSPRDDSFYSVSFPEVAITKNLGGALGSELAAHGIFQLGLVAPLVPLFFMGMSMILAKDLRRVKAIFLFCLYFLTTCMLLMYFVSLLNIPLQIDGVSFMPGGWLGRSLNHSLEKTFGKSLFLAVGLGAMLPAIFPYLNRYFLWFRDRCREKIGEVLRAMRHKKGDLRLTEAPLIGNTSLPIEDWESSVPKGFPIKEASESSVASIEFSSQSEEVLSHSDFSESADFKFEGKDSTPIIHGDEGGDISGPVNIVDRLYKFPDLDVFKRHVSSQAQGITPHELKRMDELLIKTLGDFGIKAEVIGHQTGPVVTVYEVRPEAGVKQARLLGLADDLALSLKADSLLIQPIPEKSALGIQVPNQTRQDVLMGELLEHPTFSRLTSTLSFVIGKSISGQPVYADLGGMPHLLVAGSTGSGKSVGINTLITSLLTRSSPKDVRMILVDPKMLELSVYEGIPHLLMPVITQPEKATSALRWAVHEMERRYRVMQQMQVRNIAAFNQAWLDAKEETRSLIKAQLKDDEIDTLPYIVLVIDELADLMMTAPKEIESIIQRLAQKARASGIHMVLATQRPSVDIITGVIKANLPSRIAFQVVSKHDSRTILDQMGAEKLLGKGDLLLQRPGLNKLERIQGAYVSDSEVVNFVKSIKDRNQAKYDQNLIEWVEREASQDSTADKNGDDFGEDLMWDGALEIAKSQGQISASFLQRQLKIGYNRAARIVEQMEKMGLVGKADGSKPRKWLGQTGQPGLF
ncbi:MAG: DNA translocase FtsK 4TM domain-containing protein [Pseudomonadota bacterium]